MLSAINTSIDTISGAKTQFVNTFVQNDEVKKQLQTYIDAQSSFAKDIAKSTYGFFSVLGSSATSFDVKKAFATK